MISLLTEVGPEEFLRTITSDDWQFAHDQWGAQVWAQLMAKVPKDHIYYFSPQTDDGRLRHPAVPVPAAPGRPAAGCSTGESVARLRERGGEPGDGGV